MAKLSTNFARRAGRPREAIVPEPVGDCAPPCRFPGQVALGGSGHTTSRRVPTGPAQGRITNRTDFSGIAVDGAAMLAGFYHRSVLRCGCLAERKSGVRGILSEVRQSEQKCCELSPKGYPRQPPGLEPESIGTRCKNPIFRQGAGVCDLNSGRILWQPPSGGYFGIKRMPA